MIFLNASMGSLRDVGLAKRVEIVEIKDVVLYLDAGEPNEGRLSFAVSLAERNGAALTGVCVWSEPPTDPADCYAIGPEAVTDVLSRRDAEIARFLAPPEAAFRTAAVAGNIDCRWSVAGLNESPEQLALGARCFDLAIVGRPVAREHVGQKLAELIALFSGTPCLVISEQPRPSVAFDRIVLAWNGSCEAKRALEDGLVFLKRAKSVRLIIVGGAEVEPVAQAAGDGVLRHLARHGVDAELAHIEAPHEDVGSTLLHQCDLYRADLLIMGAYGHSRAMEMVLGGATRTILGHAPLPVMLSH
ncbi:MAG: universal stress protein [Devosia sp.]|nr:universal stress protein [Devosia sp.]